jgi:hypothetical protein
MEPKDVTKGYGRMLITDTKSTSKISVRGYRYMHIILDRDTRYTELILTETRDELLDGVKLYLRKFYNQHRRFPSFWKFDQIGENFSHAMVNFLNSCGTQPIYTGTNDHNSNAHVERKIGILWDSILKTLAHSNVPFPYWDYCAEYLTIVWNHLPHRALPLGETPQSAARKTSFFNQLFVWGSGVWYSSPDPKEHQLRRRFGIFLGFSKLKMTYVILDLETRNIVESRSIKSIGNNFPFRDANRIHSSKLNMDYENWPESMPQEKISMNLENMMLKNAPILSESKDLSHNLTKTQIMNKKKFIGN